MGRYANYMLIVMLIQAYIVLSIFFREKEGGYQVCIGFSLMDYSTQDPVNLQVFDATHKQGHVHLVES